MIRTILLLFTLTAGLFAADTIAEAKKKISEKKFDEAITQLEVANKAKPTPALKTALIDANMAKADDFMANDSVPPRVKYTTALKAYREVLKYDPQNKKAKANVDTIEGIYKSMGRPIPQ